MVGGGVIIALRQHTAELLNDFRWTVLEFDRPELVTSDTPVKAMTERDRLDVSASSPTCPSTVRTY